MNNNIPLTSIKLIARGLKEYEYMFCINRHILSSKQPFRILDVASSCSSFASQMRRYGMKTNTNLSITSMDPIYSLPYDLIYESATRDLVESIAKMQSSGKHWISKRPTYGNPQRLLKYRLAVYKDWYTDINSHPYHYLPEGLPDINGVSELYDLILVGNYLFAFDEVKGAYGDNHYRYHLDSIRNLTRLLNYNGNLLIYPIGSSSFSQTEWLIQLISDLHNYNITVNILHSRYRFAKMWDKYLSISRKL